MLILDNNHWTIEDYKQRTTAKMWRNYLLNHDDKIIYKGRLRKLKAEKVFRDIVDIYKEPYNEI